jgi:AcrR family transcriptional regulator
VLSSRTDHSYRPAPMTTTPWGPAGELKSRKLRPGPGVTRADIAQDQLERLFGATVAVVAELGYEETRVADIIALAGVSRSAFYKHFDNKQECVLATVEAVATLIGAEIVAAYRDEGSWDERLTAALDTLLRNVAEQPAAARLWFIEVYAAGPEVVERMETIREVFEELAWQVIRESPERAEMPLDIVRAGLGGLRKVVLTRLGRGESESLRELAPGLMEWALSYRPPPEQLQHPRHLPAAPVPGPADSDDPRERILEAVTRIGADKGFAAMTIGDIAAAAAISFSTFYTHFGDKDEAVIAALARVRRRMRASVVPAYRAAASWPDAVGAGVHALFAFLATDTDTARLAGFESLTKGPEALLLREEAHADFRTMLEEGYRLHPSVNPVAAEAIAATATALVYDQLRRKGAERIYELAPTATFMALAPFIGAEQACAVANSGGPKPVEHATALT